MKIIPAIMALGLALFLAGSTPQDADAGPRRGVGADTLLTMVDQSPRVARDRFIDALPRETRRQVMCVALNSYHEARGSTAADRIATAMVVRNRARRAQQSMCTIVFAPSQFSWTFLPRSQLVPRDDTMWRRVLREAYAVVTDHDLHDITGGATHFYNPSVVRPTWARMASRSQMIGAHRYLVIDHWGR
jgi:N-acetylmuramoyl-L-alanine amidase